MNGRHASIIVTISLASGPALAGDLTSAAFTPRQMAHCMMKRLRANTAESYREAFKACKGQFESARSDRPAEATMTAAALPEKSKP
ncbi:MAG TPA: hypothetical protein VIY68_00445 [Steroidobacteraceae bacterium]